MFLVFIPKIDQCVILLIGKVKECIVLKKT